MMAEFVTIDLGDDCRAVDSNLPESQEADTNNKWNRSCTTCCRGSTAAGLCFIILTISGIISVPLLVAPLGKATNNSDTVNSSFGLEPAMTTIVPTSVTQPLTTLLNPHDVMQADNGFMVDLEMTTTAISVEGTIDKNESNLGKLVTLLSPKLSPTTSLKPEFKNVHDDFEQINPIRFSKSENGPSIKILCAPASDDILKLMLGPAFNPRYMSTTRPASDGVSSVSLGTPVAGFQSDGAIHKVRHHSSFKHKEFAVDGDFSRDLPKENVFASIAVWKQQRAKLKQQEEPIRPKRSAEKFTSRIRRFSGFLGEGLSVNSQKLRTPTTETPKYPWECKSKVVWEDLGDDHFPRFIRTVQCLGNRCWFNHFQCKAKAFTLKILRRKSDQCVPVPTTGAGPTRYEQEWVYEERAVTFCCECVQS